jgi:hypothetical protein
MLTAARRAAQGGPVKAAPPPLHLGKFALQLRLADRQIEIQHQLADFLLPDQSTPPPFIGSGWPDIKQVVAWLAYEAELAIAVGIGLDEHIAKPRVAEVLFLLKIHLVQAHTPRRPGR